MKTKIEEKMETVHYTEQYLIDPQHPVTINVIGCGGTGSQVLNSLGRMNSALKALGHPGFWVRAIDPDKVTEANMGRQLFSPSDVDGHKCIALIGKLNRFFGTDWEAVPELYNSAANIPSANITISCVDSGPARREIKTVLEATGRTSKLVKASHYSSARLHEPYRRPYYWMDFGNMQDCGQVVIGTVCGAIEQPKKTGRNVVSVLKTIDKLHPDIFKNAKGVDQGPSCSLAEALHKQDLFINTNLANMGLCILWKMFREAHIRHHGLYLNLKTLATNPIAVQ